MLRFASRAILAIALAMVGCTANTVVKAPGSEEGAPLDGKADSFRSPTEHGTLRFGATPSRAELSPDDDQRFHAWTFSLSGDAEVSVRTNASNPNLDTVLYLYHRTSSDERWGSYLTKNDDASDDTVFSAIERALGEGEYRIIVKGFKEQLEGPFTVSAECAGAGCESRTPEPEVSIPPTTDFTAACVGALWEAFDAPVVSTDGFGIHPDTREGYDREVLIATAHYDSVSDWDEYVYEDERAEYTFDVEVVRTAKGTLVTMADGGDESTTDYAFDADGNLLTYYVHNQSPWTEFYCGVEGDDSAGYPDEDCVDRWLRNGSYDEADVHEGTETYSPELPNDEINARMQAAIEVYVDSELDGEDGEISLEFREWETGGSYLLSAEAGAMVQYAVVDTWDGALVVFESSENGEGPEMICAQSN
jgi:hypothetical protein